MVDSKPQRGDPKIAQGKQDASSTSVCVALGNVDNNIREPQRGGPKEET